MQVAEVRNWRKFQHYKNRRPPWIKLHRELLEDPEFMALAPASRSLLMLIWLLASEQNGGKVRIDPAYLSFRLRMEIKDSILQPLIGHFLTIDASNVLADRSQVARPETEGERETEGEHPPTPLGGDVVFVSGNGNGHKPRSRFSPPTVLEVRAFCEQKRSPINPVEFVAYYEARGWRYKGNVPMKNWKAAVATWESHRSEGGS